MSNLWDSIPSEENSPFRDLVFDFSANYTLPPKERREFEENYLKALSRYESRGYNLDLLETILIKI